VATDPRGVAAATAALLADARHRAALDDAVRPVADVDIGGGPYDEHDAKELLTRLGIATTARRVCTDRASAHEALDELGGSVAVKLLDATVHHKTEVGGVHLNVRTDADLDVALDALEAVGATRFLIEAMAPSGVDLVVGARRDPVFGPDRTARPGGNYAEALADVSVRLAPLSDSDAATMPDELAAAHCFTLARRTGPTDRGARRIVATLGSLVATHPRIDEVEVNPLRLTATGLGGARCCDHHP